VPVISVDARTPENIQEAVRSAGDLRPEIKNTEWVDGLFLHNSVFFELIEVFIRHGPLGAMELHQELVLNMDSSYEGHHFLRLILSHRYNGFSHIR